MTLKIRLLIIFLSISILPTIIITGIMYQRHTLLVNRQINQIVEQINQNTINQTASVLNDIQKATTIFQADVGRGYSILDDLKKYKQPDGGYNTFDLWAIRRNMQFICQNAIYTNDFINGIYIFLPTGENIGYGTGTDIVPNYSPLEDEWYQKTLEEQGHLFISDVSKKDFILKGKESVCFSRALYDIYSKEYLGMLLIDCSPRIFDLSHINTLQSTLLLTLTHKDSGVLYSNQGDFHQDANKLEPTEISADQQEIEKYGLNMQAAINLPEISAQFMDTRVFLIWIALVFSLIFAALSLLLSFYVTKPITALSVQMGKNQGEKLVGAHKHLDRNDEIGILYNEYNRMIDSLNSYIKSEYQNKLITLDAQMRALEAQINSHFLFNTLESINSIAEVEEVKSISVMSMALGNMFRYSIKTQSELVPVSGELQNVRDYVSIQSIRFDSRFKMVYDVQPGTENVKVLKLLLQPLVENALNHGFNRCSVSGTITIKIHTMDKEIHLEVSDDGCGISAERLAEIEGILLQPAQFVELGRRSAVSIGLKNIHSRIQLYYGFGYGMAIESVEGKGTKIRLKLSLI